MIGTADSVAAVIIIGDPSPTLKEDVVDVGIVLIGRDGILGGEGAKSGGSGISATRFWPTSDMEKEGGGGA